MLRIHILDSYAVGRMQIHEYEYLVHVNSRKIVNREYNKRLHKFHHLERDTFRFLISNRCLYMNYHITTSFIWRKSCLSLSASHVSNSYCQQLGCKSNANTRISEFRAN
jgi:hypothetical protein